MSDIIFKSQILIHPGLNNSGDQHWQTLWEKKFGFERVQQKDWDTPVRSAWIETLEETLSRYDTEKVIVVGHSLACSTIVFWAQHYGKKLKGALLVAPSDTEADVYPPGTTGFKPMPLYKLPFPTITVTSSDDLYVSTERAELFADAWGSELVNIGNAGHINVASGIGLWESGLQYLKRLDR